MSNEMQHHYPDFIARSLCMFAVLSVPTISSTITAVDSYWCNILSCIRNFISKCVEGDISSLLIMMRLLL
jgi:hypothetical protein